MHYVKGQFAVVERTLTDSSRVYDVLLLADAYGRIPAITVVNAVDERAALAACDKMSEGVYVAFGGGL